MPRAVIVHGWGHTSASAWYPWLAGELRQRGWQASVPDMPDTEVPAIEPWVATLASEVGTSDEHLFLVGHSIGCQTILRYLQQLPEGQSVGGVLLVAPWLRLDPIGQDYSIEEEGIAKQWLDTPLDLQLAAAHVSGGKVALFSDNDYWVNAPYNEPRFRDGFGATTQVLHERGHFSGERELQLPEALQALLELSS